MVKLAELPEGSEPPKLTPKQKQVLEFLEENSAASVHEVCYALNITAAVVKRLVGKGLLEEYEYQVFRLENTEGKSESPSDIVFSPKQQGVFNGLLKLMNDDAPKCALLRGVTGSGKTSVFIRLIDEAVKQGKTAIMLVPEISLTPQMVGKFRRLFGDEEQYVELRIIRLPQRDSKVILAARNVTGEMREQLRQKVALQNALDLAEHASQAKSTFLTNMSHDFRTPMNSISGFASIALDHLNDTDRVRDCLRKIMLSSDHLLSLVNDILDVSRIESGKMSFNEDIVSLPDAVIEVQDMFDEKAEAVGIDLTIDVDSLAHPQVVTDPLRLNQILVNTVGNAVKFTPAGGLVTVTLTELPDAPRGFGSYRMTVSDTGCGMTPEFLDRIFLPFERDGLGYANKTEGTGLGMTITKSLVDLMGGEIAVESVVGRGSTFAITLPLRVADADELAEAREKAAAAERCQRDFTGCKVLVVDDDDLSREILVEILKDYGFKPEEARDGDAAVRKVASVEPFYYDAVLMDMRMPRMDGDEATREIRALDRPDAATLPIIAETADAFEEGQRRARDAGMTALTTKPLNIHELMALLAEHIPEK